MVFLIIYKARQNVNIESNENSETMQNAQIKRFRNVKHELFTKFRKRFRMKTTKTSSKPSRKAVLNANN